MQRQITLNATKESTGKRLDRFISSSLKDISRTLVQKLTRENQILINNKLAKSSHKLKSGDKIIISLPDLEETNVKPEKIDLDVVFEDKDLIVINKPQGMVTHPAKGFYKGTLVNALLHHCKDSLSGINGVLRPGIVHRLDKETSGLIIVCKNDKAHAEIAKQFQEKKVKKYYLALVHGKVQYDKGTINKPIGRDKIQRHKMAVVHGGRPAITHYKVVETLHATPQKQVYTLLECSPETGRTHQIRVHLKSIGHPVVGDKTYGKKLDKETMMLHAYRLIFIHPKTKKEIKLETETPVRFTSFLLVK